MEGLLDTWIKIYKFMHLDPKFLSLEIENFLNNFLWFLRQKSSIFKNFGSSWETTWVKRSSSRSIFDALSDEQIKTYMFYQLNPKFLKNEENSENFIKELLDFESQKFWVSLIELYIFLLVILKIFGRAFRYVNKNI